MNDKVIGIYKITNNMTNKVYIGESFNIYERWDVYKQDLNNNKHHSYKLQTDWNKYGESNFIFEIIKELNINNQHVVTQKLILIVLEDIFIKQYNSINNGYNIENTYDKIINLDKEVFDDIVINFKSNKNKVKHILKYIRKNIESNNGEFIPSKDLKIKNKITNKIINKPQYTEDLINNDAMIFLISLYKEHVFIEPFERISTIFQSLGFNIKEIFKILRRLNILDQQNKCIINNINFKSEYKEFIDAKDGKQKQSYTTCVNSEGFKYIYKIILKELYKTKENIFTNKLVEKLININKGA